MLESKGADNPFLSPPPAFHPVSSTAAAKHPMGIRYRSSRLETQLWAPGDGGQETTESRDLEVKSAKNRY